MNYLEAIYRNRFEVSGKEKAGSVWETLVKHFFQPLIGEGARVLDVGCGFCHFLNHLKAKEKVGVDANPSSGTYAAPDVVFHLSNDLRFEMLEDGHFDRVFISNFLEHLDNPGQVVELLARVKGLLSVGGKVIILQPNYRLLGARYFDFIDHKTILTDKGVEEALIIAGFKIEKKIVRFLPYTTKSALPGHALLVRLYLSFRPAWLLLGRQSLFVAVKQT